MIASFVFSVRAIGYSNIVKIHQDPRQDSPRSTKIHVKIHQNPRQDPPRSISRSTKMERSKLEKPLDFKGSMSFQWAQ
jgi:hypothetical protein